MGLMSIHDPDVIHCFNGVTHCPWCRKVSQNEDTIISHLRMVHYKLGLMCDQCFGCPSISSEAICCHRWKSCLLSGERGPDKSSSLVLPPAQAALGQPFLNGNQDGGIKGGSGIPWVNLLGITPALSAGTWMKDQTEGLPPTN